MKLIPHVYNVLNVFEKCGRLARLFRLAFITCLDWFQNEGGEDHEKSTYFS